MTKSVGILVGDRNGASGERSSASSATTPSSAAGLAISAASVLVGAVATWRIILWRARTRLQCTVQRVQGLLPIDGPLIDLANPGVTSTVIERSTKRASKWMTLREEGTTPMVGQVGGRSHGKKPMLTVKKPSALAVGSGADGGSNSVGNPGAAGGASASSGPEEGPLEIEDHEYVLKPVAPDHRGIREIAFYEAIEVVTRQQAKAKPSVAGSVGASSTSPTSPQPPSSSGSLSQAYAEFLSGGDVMGGGQGPEQRNRLRDAINILDAVALALAMMLQDSVIQKCEEDLKKAWKAVRREADSLHRLSKFVPRCRGVVRIGIRKRLPSVAASQPSSSTRIDPSTMSTASYQDPETVPSEGVTSSFSAKGAMNGTSHSAMLDDEAPAQVSPPQPPPSASSFSTSTSLLCASSFGVPDDSYLLLQSLTRTYARPCVMDLKMGTETYEPDCTDEKRRRESSKYAMQDVFGFRIIGMRIYDPLHDEADDKGFRLFSKDYGRSLIERKQVSEAFRFFFSAGVKKQSKATEQPVDSSSVPATSPRQRRGDDAVHGNQRVRLKAVSSVLLQLRSLRRWFEEHNTSLQFRASSLLFIYEGDPTRGGNGDVTMLKMIDFGHVRRVPGGDSGYLTGIKNLNQILTEILEEQEEDRQAAQTRDTAEHVARTQNTRTGMLT